MAEMRKRTSMSVLEMGRMLGLGKTESYWLIKKNYFKTILVGNTMRVMIDSFEEWYANQFKYQKVDGTPPGEELKKTTYSMEELGKKRLLTNWLPKGILMWSMSWASAE